LIDLDWKSSFVRVNSSWKVIYIDFPQKSPATPTRQAATKNELTTKNTTRHRPGAARLGDAVNQIKNLRHAEPKW
jgi:hypothetical protein